MGELVMGGAPHHLLALGFPEETKDPGLPRGTLLRLAQSHPWEFSNAPCACIPQRFLGTVGSLVLLPHPAWPKEPSWGHLAPPGTQWSSAVGLGLGQPGSQGLLGGKDRGWHRTVGTLTLPQTPHCLQGPA